MHTNRIAARVVVTCLLLGVAACGGGSGGSSSGGTANINYNWPANLVGEAIDFTVRDAGGASVAVGSVINYRFDAGGSVVGTNPESGSQFYPQSYTYSENGGSATIRLNYGGGAYERYQLQASDCDSGSYQLQSFDGFFSASSSGTYQITTTGTCGGSGGSGAESVPLDYDQEPNDIPGDAPAVPSPSTLQGSVSSASGGDRVDYYALTPDVSEEFSITLSDFGNNDLDLYIDDAEGNILYSSATVADLENIFETLQAGTTYYVNVFAYQTGGNTVDYELLFRLGMASGDEPVGSGIPTYTGEWQQVPVIDNGNLWLVISGSSVARCSTNLSQNSQSEKFGTLSGDTISWSDGSPATTLSDLTATTMNYNWTNTSGNSGVYNFARPVQVAVPSWCG